MPLLRALPLLLLVAGCGPTLGRHGRLGFAYHTGDQLLPEGLQRPLALGAEARVVVYASKKPKAKPNVFLGRKTLASPREVPIQRASSTDSDVLQVLEIDGARLRLSARAPGTSALTVHTARGSDVIVVSVAETHHLELDHAAWSERRAGPARSVLLAGGTVHFLVRRKDARGRSLAGLSPAQAIALTPPGAARIVSDADDGAHLRLTLGPPGRLSLTPRAGTGYLFEVVPATEVNGLALDFIRGKNARGPMTLKRGSAIWLKVHAQTADGRQALGLEGLLQLQATPARCEVRSLARWLGDGLYALRGLAPGTCRLQATLGHVSHEVSLTVE